MSVLIAICGYEGDAHQVQFMRRHHEQMGFPIVVLSPADSPIRKVGPHWCISVGKRAYIGEDSLIRQKLHLRELLKLPFSHYLVHDADSVCLSRTLPDYLFHQDVLWSNIVSDLMHQRPAGWPYPRLAFQPPYFFSRGILERFLQQADKSATANLQTPYIDFWMMEVAHDAGLPYIAFPDGASCGTPPGSIGHKLMRTLVERDGKRFCHAIKDESVFQDLLGCWRNFAKAHNFAP